ncbi:hypothetical protein U9M48_044137 [Paspalum notatum var. saurae]|uniref:Uncharacterized protein n=1 Tax=Paspalum notatum var. saurae TaxID=547442 RepID=A0AAQ3UWE0_PASNO
MVNPRQRLRRDKTHNAHTPLAVSASPSSIAPGPGPGLVSASLTLTSPPTLHLPCPCFFLGRLLVASPEGETQRPAVQIGGCFRVDALKSSISPTGVA